MINENASSNDAARSMWGISYSLMIQLGVIEWENWLGVFVVRNMDDGLHQQHSLNVDAIEIDNTRF